MKNFLIIITLFFGITAFAQVGIGTTDPQTTLDVEADVTDNTKADAVMVPRLTAAELQAKDGAYLATQNGALVFVESGTGGTAKTANVTGTGFYYYDAPNSVWVGVGADAPNVRTTANNDFIADDLNGFIIVTANVTFDVNDTDLSGAQPGDTITMMRDNGQKTFSVNNLTLGSLGNPADNGGALTIFYDGSGWRTISGY